MLTELSPRDRAHSSPWRVPGKDGGVNDRTEGDEQCTAHHAADVATVARRDRAIHTVFMTSCWRTTDPTAKGPTALLADSLDRHRDERQRTHLGVTDHAHPLRTRRRRRGPHERGEVTTEEYRERVTELS